MFTKYLCHSELSNSRARIFLKTAAIVFASCEGSFHEPAVLFDSGTAGPIVCIDLEDGDLLLETTNFAKVCDIVAEIKGECHFNMLHTGVAAIPCDQWPDGGAATDQADTEGFDQDHDSADWWKRGAE